MAEDEEQLCKVEYLEGREEDDGKVYNWVMRPGKVRITYVDGSTFEGSVNDERMKHGKGVYQWKKPGGEGEEEPVVKATYEGEYWNGKRQGRGKMVFPSGDTYHGEWKDNKMNGEGTYIYKKTADIFSGTWVDGVKSGQGAYQFGADKAVLKGTWVNGTITNGQWIFADGTVYTGTFQDGKPVGPGSFALSNGITQSGEYVVKKEGEEGAEEIKINWKGQSVVVV